MQQESVSEVIRKYFAAFLAQDRKTLEEGLSEDFTFTSPRDDHISKAAFFERCLPGSEQFLTHQLEGNKIKEVEVYFGSA
jgi:ketosteroid isomerase-like protein